MSYFGTFSPATGSNPQTNNETEFRLWGMGISNLFSSCSWVTESAVTNAIQWTSILKPSGSSKAGFEVWKMNDGLATGSLRNIYVRIDYGIGSNGATTPSTWFTVGTSCSTLGVIGSTNGGMFGPISLIQPNASNAGPFTSYVSGDSNRINLLVFGQTPGVFSDGSYHWYFGAERLKNTVGVDIEDGVHICLYGVPQSTRSCWNIIYTGSAYGSAGYVGPEVRYQAIASSTSSYNFQIGAGLHIPIVGYALPPLLGSVGLSTYDCAPLQQVTIPIYGTNHTYLSLKNTAGAAASTGLGNPFYTAVVSSFIAMRYE